MDFCGQKIKLWKPSGAVSDVTLRDLPAEGTFLAMQKEIRGLTAVGAGQVLAENVARESGPAHHWHKVWLPTRKRKLRKVCAPESSPKTLQVDSLPEVWASLAQRPVLRHSGWFLGVACGAWRCWESSHVFGRFGRFSGVYELTIGATRNSPDATIHVNYEGRTNFSMG